MEPNNVVIRDPELGNIDLESLDKKEKRILDKKIDIVTKKVQPKLIENSEKESLSFVKTVQDKLSSIINKL